MAKIHTIKGRPWLWLIVCVVFFFAGIIVGKSVRTQSQPTNPGVVTFTMPTIPLPANWSSKENLPGNSFETALALNTGIQTQGTINENNAIDYYSFTVKDPSQIILNVTNVPKALYWVLYDGEFKTVASSYRTGTTQGSSQISLQNPGTYYIKVWADYHQFANYPYTIRLSILPYFE